MRALEGRALGDIQDWNDRDEAVVASLREALRGGSGGAPVAPAGAYAAHAVAAGVYEAVAGAAPPHGVMDRMVGMLAEMHRANPDWSSSARGGRATAAVAL